MLYPGKSLVFSHVFYGCPVRGMFAAGWSLIVPYSVLVKVLISRYVADSSCYSAAPGFADFVHKSAAWLS